VHGGGVEGRGGAGFGRVLEFDEVGDDLQIALEGDSFAAFGGFGAEFDVVFGAEVEVGGREAAVLLAAGAGVQLFKVRLASFHRGVAGQQGQKGGALRIGEGRRRAWVRGHPRPHRV
jgi:hypothetical protein